MADFVKHCQRGDLGEVIAAVGRGVDVNSVDSGAESGLMMAAYKSHNHVVEWLLQQPATDVSRQDNVSETALQWAVMGNNPAGLSLLLAHPPAEPTGRDDNGKTILEQRRWGTGRQGET